MRGDLYDLHFDQLYDRLFQVLSALPVIESRRDDVGEAAGYLCDVYWSPPNNVAPDLTKQDERDLRALWKLVNALRLHIVGKISENARVAMKIDHACLHQLVRMEMTAERILDRLGTPRPGRPRKLRAAPGRPRKLRADKITMAAFSVFLSLTGMHPALRTNSEGVAYGPFIDFLKAVFEACRITASAEARFKAFQRR